jgi:MFS family permease
MDDVERAAEAIAAGASTSTQPDPESLPILASHDASNTGPKVPLSEDAAAAAGTLRDEVEPDICTVVHAGRVCLAPSPRKDHRQTERSVVAEKNEEHQAPPSRRMIVLLCVLYFLGGISASTFGRFSAVYYLSRGLDAFQIGLLEGIMPIVRSIIGPCWGYVADITKRKKLVSQSNRFISLVFLCCLGVHALSDEFWKILVVTLMTTLFCGAGSILDAYALEVCGAASQRLYGRIRLWTAVSWGVGTLIMGLIAHADHEDWKWNFVLYAAFGVTNIAVTVILVPDRTRLEDDLINDVKANGEGEEERRRSVLRAFIVSPPFIGLVLQAVFFAAAMGIVERLVFVFLVNELGGSTVLCGMCVFVNVLLEIPVFYNAEVIKQSLGHRAMFSISLVCHVVRLIGYTLLEPHTKLFILLLEALHGITFALMWLYIVQKSNASTPKGWAGTVQGIVGNAASCLGLGGGAIMGGYIMRDYGAKQLYRWAAVAVAAVVLMHWAFWLSIKMRDRRRIK